VGVDILRYGQELVADAKDWIYATLHGRKYPTGWVPVDNVLEGGLMGGEYGLIMAPPGAGKTTSLVNIGYSLAGLYGGANVLHVSAEMLQYKVLAKYAVRVTGIPLKRGDSEVENKVLQALETKAQKRLRGRLRVIYLEDKRVMAIRTLIDKLQAEGFETDALIVDYADLLHTKHRNEKRFELADISRELRDLGASRNIPVWSATQAGRQALGKEVITMADVAEAIEKAAIADVIISICQTPDEKKLGTGRLFMAKVRDGEGGGTFPVKIDFSRSLILSAKNDL
jgi:replicative DNA helicase